MPNFKKYSPFTNEFRFTTNEFLSQKIQDDLEHLYYLFEKYYCYLNTWHNMVIQDYYLINIVKCEKKIKSFHDKIFKQLEKINLNHGIKFDMKKIYKNLYPENGYLQNENDFIDEEDIQEYENKA